MNLHEEPDQRFEIVFNLGVSPNNIVLGGEWDSKCIVNTLVTLEQLKAHVNAMKDIISMNEHL